MIDEDVVVDIIFNSSFSNDRMWVVGTLFNEESQATIDAVANFACRPVSYLRVRLTAQQHDRVMRHANAMVIHAANTGQKLLVSITQPITDANPTCDAMSDYDDDTWFLTLVIHEHALPGQIASGVRQLLFDNEIPKEVRDRIIILAHQRRQVTLAVTVGQIALYKFRWQTYRQISDAMNMIYSSNKDGARNSI